MRKCSHLWITAANFVLDSSFENPLAGGNDFDFLEEEGGMCEEVACVRRWHLVEK